MLELIVPVVIFAVVLIPLVFAYRASLKGKSIKRGLFYNFTSFGVLTLAMIIFAFAMPASAETAQTAAAASDGINKGLSMLAAALAMGIPGIGGGIAIASSATAAIGATSEDPKMLGRSIIFVALGESIVLFGFIIAIFIINKA